MGERCENGRFDVAHLFYARFQSALVQEPTEQQIIPVPMPEKAESAEGVTAAVEYEPDEEEILAELLPRNVAVQIDRKSVVSGKSVSVRVDLGGRRSIKKKKKDSDGQNKDET